MSSPADRHAPDEQTVPESSGVPNYSTARQYYVVVLLALAGTLSFIDRQILAVMIGPIKRDLGGLTDTQISLIIGIAFALIYSLASLPLARIADRYNRRNLIAAGIAGWSAMTAMAGFANSFWQLFAARMGVGIGEATLGPATTSLVADYWARERLPLAYGIVAIAPFLGTGIASIVGGPLIDYLEARPRLSLPLFGEMYSWQSVLVLVGLPGVLFALAMFTMREPKRLQSGLSTQDAALGKGGDTDHYSYGQLWEFVKSRWDYLKLHFLAYLCLSIQGFAFLTWVVEFFVRKHDWSRTQIGVSYGLIAIVIGIIGSIWAGYYAGKLIKKGKDDGPMRLTYWGTLGLAPLAIAMPLVSNAWLSLALVIPITFVMAMPPGLSNAALQAIAPPRLRGQLIAVYLICVSFISYALAPVIIGAMNDFVFKRESAIDLSLATLAAINYAIAAFCLGKSLKPLRAHLTTAASWRAG